MPMPTCPSREQLYAYLRGKLSVVDAQEVFDHLEKCPDCEAAVVTLEGESEADPLLSSLRLPTPADQYETEPECEEAMARAELLATAPVEGGMSADAAESRGATTELRHARRSSGSHWRPIAMGSAVAGILLLVVMLTLATRYGTLVVETDDQDVEVAVKQGGEEVEVLDAESGWTIRLRPGKYEVEAKGDQHDIKLDQDTVVVAWGETVRVAVTPKPPPPPPSNPWGLAMHWPFDEGIGTETHALGGADYRGVLKNMDADSAWSQDVPPTKSPNRFALKLDGKDDCVEIEGFPGVVSEGAFGAWIKTTNTTELMYLIGSANKNGLTRLACSLDGREDARRGPDGGMGEFKIHLRDEKGRQFIAYPKHRTNVCDGRWHHFTVTWDGESQNVRIYVDGVSQQVVSRDEGAGEAPREFCPFEFPLWLGACNEGDGPTAYFDGLMDNVRLYNLLPPEDKIKELATRND